MTTATIRIEDEVNCKIQNLDLGTRQKLVKMFAIEVPHARHMPSFKLGRWNGKVNFFQLGGNTYINMLEEILPILMNEGYDIQLDDRRNYSSHFEFPVVDKNTFSHIKWPKGHRFEGTPIVLNDHQVVAINNFLRNPQCMQEIATGAGKCQPYDSKVLTPSGWTTMGKINAGDMVVVPDGSNVKVTQVFEPGVKDVYEITFSDGRTARSCEDHIWPIYNIDWRKDTKLGGPIRNISLKEVIKLKERTSRSIGIPLAPMRNDNSTNVLPMDPWLMGFLLGDGSFRNHVAFSSADQELIDKVKNTISPEYTIKHLGNYDYAIVFKNKENKNSKKSEYLKNVCRNDKGYISLNERGSYHLYNKILIEEELFNLKSHEKFIPPAYFDAGYDDRVEIIKGLVDSDGTIDKGSIKFTSTSRKLAEGFQRLIRSVGGIAKISTKTNATYMYNGVKTPCRDSYTVATKLNDPWNFVSLQRKKDATGYSYQYADTLKLNIESIKKVSTEPVKCIMIDHPDHLYITDDYVVTHNTIITAALSLFAEAYGRSIVIVPNKSLVTQTEEDYINMGLDVGVYYGNRKEWNKTHTICTWQSLNQLFKDSKNGKATLTFDDFIEDVQCVIIDEVHSAKADALKAMLSGPMAHIPLRWGLTGTVPKEKFEKQTIECTIGKVIGQVSAAELQKLGLLANCHVHIKQLQDNRDLGNYQSELKYLLGDADRLDHIAEMLVSMSLTGNTLVLVDRVGAAQELALRMPPDRTAVVTGKVKVQKRKEEYDEIADVDDKIIIATYGVAAVGLNIPRIFNLVLIEPGKSFVRVIQSIGRSLRVSDDKDYADIYDITSNCKFAKRHLTKRKQFYREAEYPFKVEKIHWQK